MALAAGGVRRGPSPPPIQTEKTLNFCSSHRPCTTQRPRPLMIGMIGPVAPFFVGLKVYSDSVLYVFEEFCFLRLLNQ